MKRESWITVVVAAGLAFLLSFGAVGCLVSAFELEAAMGSVCFGCLIFSVGASISFRLKRGDLILFGILAVALGFLWRSGTLEAQVGALLYEISRRYDSAYGWGYVNMPPGDMEAALLCIGCAIALAASLCVARNKGSLGAVTLALIPVFACLVVTDTVPGEGWLFCLLLGLILMMLTGYMRTTTPDQANFLTGLALIPVAAGLGLLFLAMPQDDYVNRAEELQEQILEWILGVPQDIGEAAMDLFTEDPEVDVPEEVLENLNMDQARKYDLSAQGPRSDIQATVEVMDVEADTGGTLYLRGQDYDSYTGKTWTTSSRRQEDLELEPGLGVDAGDVTVSTRWEWDVRYVPYYPEDGLTLEGGRYDNDGSLRYTFTRMTLPAGWRQQTRQGSTGEVDERYLELPEDTRAWAEDMVEDILRGETTATEIADAIAAYVRSSAVYDLSTGKMPSGEDDFARWFLEDSDTGYCVHFATAAAVLLRAAGVECRYVTGYLVSARAGTTVTVTADRAHAWVEYYEPSLDAWIVLEATPASGESPVTDPENTEYTELPSQDQVEDPQTGESQQAGTEPGETGDPVTGTRPGGNEDRETEPEETEEDEDHPSRREDPEWEIPGWLIWLAVVLILAAGMVAQRYIRLESRRKRIRKGEPNRRAVALWREVTAYAGALKAPVPEDLENLAQKAKYSQHTLTEGELNLFDQYLRAARNACRAKPWYLRLLYRWIYALY